MQFWEKFVRKDVDGFVAKIRRSLLRCSSLKDSSDGIVSRQSHQTTAMAGKL
jgi:hypothetical protein